MNQQCQSTREIRKWRSDKANSVHYTW